VLITTSTNGFCFTIETAVGHQDVAVGIEAKKVAKRLHGDDGTGHGIVFRYCILEKNL